MKKITVILLAGTMILAGQLVNASDDDYSKGYRSKFYGTVEQIPSNYIGTWIVNGRQIEVTPRTEIEQEYGRATVGSYVEIKGSSDGRTFDAYELEVKRGSGDDDRGDDDDSGRHEFYGTINAKPQGRLGTWMIDGREVYVNERTRFEEEDGPARIGARVEVKGSYQQGTFVVRELEVER